MIMLSNVLTYGLKTVKLMIKLFYLLYSLMNLFDETLETIIDEFDKDSNMKITKLTIIGYHIASKLFIQILENVQYIHKHLYNNIQNLSVRLSVCLSVCLSDRPFSRPPYMIETRDRYH
jgi:hypothetical protein